VAGATVVAVPFESSFEERREARRGEPPKPLATTTNRPDGTWVLTLAPAAAPRDGAALVRLKVSGGGTAPTLLESVFDAVVGVIGTEQITAVDLVGGGAQRPCVLGGEEDADIRPRRAVIRGAVPPDGTATVTIDKGNVARNHVGRLGGVGSLGSAEPGSSPPRQEDYASR
jgi:hypothetical protein